MKKLFLLVMVLVLTACTQTQPVANDEDLTAEPKAEEVTEVVEEAPGDYVGVWLRTATYVNGALQHQTPATLTLNPDNYTSTGDCINTGQVISEGEGLITLTLDSTTCQNVPTGGSYTSTYSMAFDEETDVEVMTMTTGNMMETYNRQS